jgi:hypothetical protein
VQTFDRHRFEGREDDEESPNGKENMSEVEREFELHMKLYRRALLPINRARIWSRKIAAPPTTWNRGSYSSPAAALSSQRRAART